MAKTYFLDRSEIFEIVPGHGSCFATDRITVDGQRVGYMYREAPDHEIDSGWRFMAGDETQEYMDDADNLDLYEVNTIANYDPDIVPFLDAQIGSAFERRGETGQFQQVPFEPLSD